METNIEVRMRDSYQWRSGSRFTIDPGVVGSRLEAIAEENGGRVTTESVAREAGDAHSPIYELFESDPLKVAHEYRMQRARQIVGSLIIVTIIPPERKKADAPVSSAMEIDIVIEDESTVSSPAFPSVIENGQRYYTPMQNVLHRGVLRDQYASSILSELKRIATKASNFKIFASVVDAIDLLPTELGTA